MQTCVSNKIAIESWWLAAAKSQMLTSDSMDSIFMAAFRRCDASATAA